MNLKDITLQKAMGYEICSLIINGFINVVQERSAVCSVGTRTGQIQTETESTSCSETKHSGNAVRDQYFSNL